MSRLTEVDEYGNADIIGMEDETWQMGLSFNDMNKMTLALNRLHRLEKLYEQHKQPDPNTGLMPCGCGGKAKIWLKVWPPIEDADDYEVGCTKCEMTTGWVHGKQEDAMKVWNTAMGRASE